MLPNKEGHWWHKRSEDSEPWPVYIAQENKRFVVKHAHVKDLKQYGGTWIGPVTSFEKAEEMKFMLSQILRFIKCSDDETEIGEWMQAMKDEISETIEN